KLPFMALAQSALAVASAHDPLAFDLRPESVAITGSRILYLLTLAVAGSRALVATIDDSLARAWQVLRGGDEVLRAGLILCADHELNVSAFTSRWGASSGSRPYAVVVGGLGERGGTRAGG